MIEKKPQNKASLDEEPEICIRTFQQVLHVSRTCDAITLAAPCVLASVSHGNQVCSSGLSRMDSLTQREIALIARLQVGGPGIGRLSIKIGGFIIMVRSNAARNTDIIDPNMN